jgi:hypothetical protein
LSIRQSRRGVAELHTDDDMEQENDDKTGNLIACFRHHWKLADLAAAQRKQIFSSF